MCKYSLDVVPKKFRFFLLFPGFFGIYRTDVRTLLFAPSSFPSRSLIPSATGWTDRDFRDRKSRGPAINAAAASALEYKSNGDELFTTTRSNAILSRMTSAVVLKRHSRTRVGGGFRASWARANTPWKSVSIDPSRASVTIASLLRGIWKFVGPAGSIARESVRRQTEQSPFDLLA